MYRHGVEGHYSSQSIVFGRIKRTDDIQYVHMGTSTDDTKANQTKIIACEKSTQTEVGSQIALSASSELTMYLLELFCD